jgi:hypothetical protein
MVKQLQAVNSLGVDIMDSYVDGVRSEDGYELWVTTEWYRTLSISVIAKVLRLGPDLRRW